MHHSSINDLKISTNTDKLINWIFYIAHRINLLTSLQSSVDFVHRWTFACAIKASSSSHRWQYQNNKGNFLKCGETNSLQEMLKQTIFLMFAAVAWFGTYVPLAKPRAISLRTLLWRFTIFCWSSGRNADEAAWPPQFQIERSLKKI